MAVRARDQVTLQKVADVSYLRTYYRLQASSSGAPSAPTTNPPPAPWTTTEPGYTAGATNTLYTVQLSVWSDGFFQYGPVQTDSKYEAAKQAYNLAQAANGAAVAAQNTADGKNSIYVGLLEPVAPTGGFKNADLWYVLRSGTASVEEIRMWGGSSWAPYGIVADSVMVPGSVGTVSIGDGVITAPKVKVRELEGEHFKVGTISVNELTPNIGSTLDITINPAISEMQSDLELQQRYYRFDSQGLKIGDPVTSEELRLNPGRIEMVQAGNVPTYWEAQNFYVERMIVKAANIGEHRFEKYATGRTVLRPLRGN